MLEQLESNILESVRLLDQNQEWAGFSYIGCVCFIGDYLSGDHEGWYWYQSLPYKDLIRRAVFDMVDSGLLWIGADPEWIKSGYHFHITDRGREMLSKYPANIIIDLATSTFLKQASGKRFDLPRYLMSQINPPPRGYIDLIKPPESLLGKLGLTDLC